MSNKTSLAAASVLAAFACTQPAVAGEQTLEFKLVTKAVDLRPQEVPNVEGQLVVTGKMQGVAYFKDGRVASKDFIHNADLNKGSGPFFGYSTYNFEDGSTITARYAGTLKAGQPMHGEYTVLSGTGAFAGATGSGMFDSTPHKLPQGTFLFNAKLMVKTP